MWRIVKENPRSALYAVLVHLLLLGLLMINVDWSSMTHVAPQHADTPVQARVVEEDQLRQEVERQQQEVERQRAAEAERQRQLEEQAAAARRQREQEERRVADLKRQQAEEARRLEEARASAQKEKAAAEAKRKAEAEARQKAAAEAKRKAEEEAKRKAEAEAAAKRKAEAEAEAKRKAEADARRKVEEAERQAELAAERARLDQERQRAVAAAINQYSALIQDRVKRNWRLPPNWRGLSCVVQVKMIPGGDVVSVRIVRSSGDPVFDRSVESAVFQAAPLPVPSEPHLFEAFREFNFIFDPNRS
jgi:colicin import membrane protein